MKVVAKAIEMVAWFEENGAVHPTKFRIVEEDETVEIIKIDRIIKQTKERFAGNYLLVFTCQSLINDLQKVYEIKYEVGTCKWILFKI